MDSQQQQETSVSIGSSDEQFAPSKAAEATTATSSIMRRNTPSTSTSTSVGTSLEEGTYDPNEHEFIDYTPPPACSLPPPAKYKLWLLVLFLVYFASWFAEAAGIVRALSRSGYLNSHAALFVMLGIVVFVLVYAALDLTVLFFTFTIRGISYGLGPWLKSPRLAPRLLECYNNNVIVQTVAILMGIFEDGFAIFNPPISPSTTMGMPKDFECDFEGHVVLKIEHILKEDGWEAYYDWQKKICKLVKSQPGLVDAVACEPDGDRQVIMLTFTSIDRLNEYMNSPARRKLMAKLEPLLKSPDSVQLQKDRDLPDAFTDLLTRQGECVPTVLPKKWKVWWLTTCGLFFVLLIEEAVMPYYYTQWGLDTAHDRLRGLVTSIVVTWFNSFVMTPFLLMIFSDWVKRKPEEIETQETWRTLCDGISTVWLKVFVAAAFYGGCVIAWAVKE